MGKYAYVGLLMVLCWMLELIPLAVIALLPVALFLILGVASMAYVSVQYLNKTCMRFVGSKQIWQKITVFGLETCANANQRNKS